MRPLRLPGAPDEVLEEVGIRGNLQISSMLGVEDQVAQP